MARRQRESVHQAAQALVFFRFFRFRRHVGVCWHSTICSWVGRQGGPGLGSRGARAWARGGPGLGLGSRGPRLGLRGPGLGLKGAQAWARTKKFFGAFGENFSLAPSSQIEKCFQRLWCKMQNFLRRLRRKLKIFFGAFGAN